MQNYAHHHFGSSALLTAEGAELRGSMTEPAITAPYHLLGNGSSLLRDNLRCVDLMTMEVDLQAWHEYYLVE